MVKTCETCQENSCKNYKDPAIPREIPVALWSTIEMDNFTLDGYSFLLVVDVTSRFSVVCILNNETRSSAVNAQKGIYCIFGLPKCTITENGPCFKATEFNDFHANLGVVTERSSAYNHQ